MIALVDTSVLIDHLRGHDGARTALADLVARGDVLAGSVVTRTEVLAGLRSGEEAATTALLDALRWIPLDRELADGAGAMANRYLRSHPGVEVADFVVAATALRLRAQLVTRNVRHFPMFADLSAPY